MEMTLSVDTRAVARYLAGRKRKPALERAAMSQERGFRRLFLLAVKTARMSMPEGELSMIVLDDAITEMIHVLTGGEDAPLPTSLEPLRAAAGRRTTLETLEAKAMEAGANASTLVIKFDIENPRATDWVRRRAADLVSEIDAESKAALRTLFTKGFENRVPTRETARIIRASIGLTERQAASVMNRQLKMLAAGVSNEAAARNAERYALTLVKKRADLIAYQETMTAAAEGQRELWRQAGLPDTVKKILIQYDPCPVCSPMAEEVVGVNDSFSGGLPPFHVRCRCVEGLVN